MPVRHAWRPTRSVLVEHGPQSLESPVKSRLHGPLRHSHHLRDLWNRVLEVVAEYHNHSQVDFQLL